MHFTSRYAWQGMMITHCFSLAKNKVTGINCAEKRHLREHARAITVFRFEGSHNCVSFVCWYVLCLSCLLACVSDA